MSYYPSPPSDHLLEPFLLSSPVCISPTSFSLPPLDLEGSFVFYPTTAPPPPPPAPRAPEPQPYFWDPLANFLQPPPAYPPQWQVDASVKRWMDDVSAAYPPAPPQDTAFSPAVFEGEAASGLAEYWPCGLEMGGWNGGWEVVGGSRRG